MSRALGVSAAVVAGMLAAVGLALSSPVVTGVGGAAGVGVAKPPPVCGPLCVGGGIGIGGKK